MEIHISEEKERGN